ncbi:MAG: carbamoyltransferase C-terminal domain-containing protein [Polyangiales bacterium]
MRVLGINFSNDAAAALVVDGHVIAACQEERFTRRKHDAQFPAHAIRMCLAEADLALPDIDAIGFFWNPGIHLEAANAKQIASPRDHLEYLYCAPAHLLRLLDEPQVERVEQTLYLRGNKPLRIHYLTHHDCHTAGAFYRSNYASAAVLTVDGYGERTSTQIARASAHGLETLARIEYPHSIGSFYACFTEYLGFRPNSGEGKVMGLASYGRPQFYAQIRRMVQLTDTGFELDLSYFSFYLPRRHRYSSKLVDTLGPARAPESELTQRHMDIAASMQAVTEELLLHVGRLARSLTGESRLCMAGGVALNCVANTRLRYELGFEDAFFMPAASDAGTSIGAALYVAHVLGEDKPVVHPDTDYLGPAFDEHTIEHHLAISGCSYTRPPSIAEATASLLAEGKIVGWFQGRAELGPRALGNRSILADPRPADMKDVVNARVKFREYFRPFAPAVPEDRCGEFFEHADPSPYMLLVYKTRAEHYDRLRSVTHVDGGARVQTVRPDQNPLFHELLTAFGARTGLPVLLNTSFNIRGEPVVHSVPDALKCYFTTDLDALAVGPFLLVKREARTE